MAENENVKEENQKLGGVVGDIINGFFGGRYEVVTTVESEESGASEKADEVGESEV